MLHAGSRPGRIRLLIAAFFSWAMRQRLAHVLIKPFFARAHLWLFRVTDGRVNITNLVVPSLVLFSTGAKSGLPRETPLMCWPEDGGTFLVAGSNWAKPAHPAWTANLIAHPDVDVVFKGTTIPVHAALLRGVERDAAWPTLEAQWPEYRKYEHDSGREIRIFRLRPR